MAETEAALLVNHHAFVAFARERMGDPHPAAGKPDEHYRGVPWFYRIRSHPIVDRYLRPWD